MKLAHLIIAHTEPKQLERLITRIAHPDAHIYIHLDKKTNIQSFAYLKEYDNVTFIKKRIKVFWGSYSIVKATINSFKEILTDGRQYDFVNLLSGQDYPLQSPQKIHAHLSRHENAAFMSFLLFEPDWPEAMARIRSYFFNSLWMPGRYTMQNIINKIFPQRTFPNKLVPVGSSQWFTISFDCVRYIVNYWDNNAKLRRFVRLTWAPDEYIFQTILYNSKYRGNMVNDNLRYIDWSKGGLSPKTLTMEDALKIMQSGKFYARKFDFNISIELMQFIDDNLKN